MKVAGRIVIVIVVMIYINDSYWTTRFISILSVIIEELSCHVSTAILIQKPLIA